jgi:hypothetical protein
VRKVVAVALSLAIQGAALSAPLVHAHLDDHATPHHDGHAIHTHWSAHPQSWPLPDAGAVGSDDDHDGAVFLNVFVAVTASLVIALAVVDTPVELVVPPERPALGGVEVVHGHDPPYFTSLSPRAPPAFLS